MSASELYRQGRLQDAIDAATAEVKAKPNDAGRRSFLCDLLCIAGAFERADKQLDTLSQLEPALAVAVAMSRQLARAAVWRRQFFDEGRLPEFAGKPSPLIEQHLKASVLSRQGDAAAAAALLAEARSQRKPVAVTCDGKACDDVFDLDDVLAPVLEVFTANGKYYWIAFEQVASVSFSPPRTPRDLLWRPARIHVNDGPEGDVHLPALYHGSDKSPDDSIRLGRSTSWSGANGEPVRGLGQRMLLVGEDDRSFLEISELAARTAAASH